MENLKRKLKKKLEKCKSSMSVRAAGPSLSKSKSWPRIRGSSKSTTLTTPDGCFAVYVGAEKQRFVVSTKHTAHPLFLMLLDDAELEYGHCSQGPLLLPCHVDLFAKVLAEMDIDAHRSTDDEEEDGAAAAGCYRMGRYTPFTPSKSLKMNQFY